MGQTANYVNPADQQSEAQTTYVLIPVEKERVIERTIIVEDAGDETPVAPSETSFMPEEFAQQMPVNEQTSQFNEQAPDFQEFNEQRPDFQEFNEQKSDFRE